jgi:uncharacterized membrane protein YkoI
MTRKVSIQILAAFVVLGLITGCAEIRNGMGASGGNDQNVLTGGPITGTTIRDLPEAVKNTLRELAPMAEVADIDKEKQNDRIIYRIAFSEPGRNSEIFVAEDGTIVKDQRNESAQNSVTSK